MSLLDQPTNALKNRWHHAHAMIAPFFAPESQWANVTLDHLAYRVVREHYPEFGLMEVHVLVVATKYVCTKPTRRGYDGVGRRGH